MTTDTNEETMPAQDSAIPAILPSSSWTIHERLVAILGALPAIGKDQRNEQQKFMYRGHDDVMNALNPLLAEHGVYVVPDVVERLTDERTTQRGSTMYEVNLHVRYRFYGAGGDFIEASTWGEGTDSGDKATNKAHTMAFKNVLAQVFALATAELSDADATSPEETIRAQRQQEPSGPRLLPNAVAVRSSEDTKRLAEMQRGFAADIDWPALMADLAQRKYGTTLDGLTREQTAEWWVRLANSVELTYQQLDAPELGALNPQIAQGYAQGFDLPLEEVRALVEANTPEAAHDAEGADAATEPQDDPAAPEEGAESATDGDAKE